MKIRLSQAEHDEILHTAEALNKVPPGLIDNADWLTAARDLSCTIPLGVRQAVRAFTQDPAASGVLLLENLPIAAEQLPDTPSVADSVQRKSSIPASVLTLISFQIGEPVAYYEEKSGALVQDVVPVPGREKFQGNSGSTDHLNEHVENAFHPMRPDFVGLLALRRDRAREAKLTTASCRQALQFLSGRHQEILHRPEFVTSPPPSFGSLQTRAEPHSILAGSKDDPDLTVDFSATKALTPAALEAMKQLRSALSAARNAISLSPGEMAWVDNRIVVHGRTVFQPAYDGRDRWLQRIFVRRELWSSRTHRRGADRVIFSNSSHIEGNSSIGTT